MNERAALCREIASKHAVEGNHQAAERWEQAAEQAEEREKAAKRLVDAQWVHPEALEAAE